MNLRPRRRFWNSISARRTGSSAVTSPMPISVSLVSCRSRCRPTARGFSARRRLECAADGYPSLEGSVRRAGTRPNCPQSGRAPGGEDLLYHPAQGAAVLRSVRLFRLRRSREQQALPRCARAATTRMRGKEAQFVRFCRRSRAAAVLRDVKAP